MPNHSFGRLLAIIRPLQTIWLLTLNVTEKIAWIFCASHSGYDTGSGEGAVGFRVRGAADGSGWVTGGVGRLTGRVAGAVDVTGFGDGVGLVT